MKEKFDVIVAGGGPSGVTAAIAAARQGMKTLLIERYGFLGGMGTAALVGPWMTFHDRQGSQVIRGIPEEIVQRLIMMGGSPGHVPDTTGYVATVTPFDAELLKLAYLDLCLESGVTLLFHTWVIDTKVRGSKVRGVEIVNKSGRSTLFADVVIDATGDGDVAVFAGAEYEMGRAGDNLTQPMSLMFVLGDVDLSKVKTYMQDHPEEFYEDTKFSYLKDASHLSVNGFYSKLKKAQERQEIDLDRNMVLFFQTARPDQITVNMTRAVRASGVDPWQSTEAEILLRRQMRQLLEFFKNHIPGFENTYIVASGPQAGVRESRRIIGDYVLTAADITAGVEFADRVLRNAYPIDIHDPDGVGVETIDIEAGSYTIPYRCFLPKGIEGLLVVGRCISCTHETLAAVRTQPSVMAMGQAAGTAAALAVKNGCGPRAIDIAELQDLLKEASVNL
ncbi:MAG TPA: FAD-dependent oxidoreductase [Firmicutes bacterium]|nr:FAD-dependent oxidoreductase [Bacillota bacterium]